MLLLVILMALPLLVSACASDAAEEISSKLDGAFVEYQRDWPDGVTEWEAIADDGTILMFHGDRVERFSLPQAEVEMLREALTAEIPIGSRDDSPVRTLTLEDGTVIQAPRPEPGSITELLERLMERHSLG
jgi:hypothetical protein